MDALVNTRKCAVCKKTYTVLDSVGKLECMEHASTYIAVAKNGRMFWPCCLRTCSDSTPDAFYKQNYTTAAKGCVRCDHKDNIEPYCRRNPVNHDLHQFTEEGATLLVPKSAAASKSSTGFGPLSSQTNNYDDMNEIITMFSREDAQKVFE